MVDVFVYCTKMPHGVREMVVPCMDGYTVYVDEELTRNQQQRALLHALNHIVRCDHDGADVQQIESEAHATAQ